MIHFEIPKNQSSIIKVIGVGGGGGNAVNYMYNLGINGVDFIVCNTDSQALTQSPIPNKIQLGPHLTQGLGAGANPDIGKQAGEESMEDITKILKVNTRMAFITAGMGGGTGTGGAPVVAKACRDLGILTVGIVTTPFAYEGRKRITQAQKGIDEMREHVDTILIISNDKLRQQYGNLPFTQAFAKADNVLATAAKCITDLITVDGKVNLDFNDVQTVMKKGGVAILGSAQAAGDDRAQVAVQEALNSPLLNDSEIQGAKWILLNVTSAAGDHEHTLDELDIIQGYVQQQAGHTCDIILGMGHDPNLEDKIAVTIIATGFNHKDITESMPKISDEPKKIVVELGQKDAEKLIEVGATDNIVKVVPEDPYAPKLVEYKPVFQPVIPAAQPQPQQVTDETKTSFTLELPKAEEEKETASIPAATVENKKEEEVPVQQFELIIKNTEPATAKEEQVKIGDRILTEHEMEERRRFEEQKKALEERAERLRRMSFNIPNPEQADEIENVPAYQRRNMSVNDSTEKSDEQFLSGYTVKNDGNKTNISSINTFLDGNKPD